LIESKEKTYIIQLLRNHMKVLKLLFILLICGFNHANGQRTVHIKDVGWQFTLPAGTNLLNPAFNKKGVLNKTIPSDGTYLMMFYMADTFKGSVSAYVRKNNLSDTTWRAYRDSMSEKYLKHMQDHRYLTLLHTYDTTESINNVDFIVQYYQYMAKEAPATAAKKNDYHYFGRIGDYELMVTISYSNDETGKKYMDIFHQSKFKK
jgi:hypothetical protein